MAFKFEEANKVNEKLILFNKLDKLLTQIAKEFTNNFGKQTINSEIINKVKEMNNKYEGKNRIPKTENEITIDVNIKDVDNDLIKQYWYLMQNKNIDIVPFRTCLKSFIK